MAKRKPTAIWSDSTYRVLMMHDQLLRVAVSGAIQTDEMKDAMRQVERKAAAAIINDLETI